MSLLLKSQTTLRSEKLKHYQRVGGSFYKQHAMGFPLAAGDPDKIELRMQSGDSGSS